MTGKCSNCGHVSETSTCHECGCIVPGIPMQLWEMGSAGGAIMADAYDKLKIEHDKLTAEMAEARAIIDTVHTAIALEDAVLVEKHRHDSRCPGRQRGGQPVDDCDCSCGVFASKERIRDAIAAARAERERKPLPGSGT